MIKIGLDFGTTNSSISVSDGKKVEVVEIDPAASDPRIIRSMLYFERRKQAYGPKVTPEKIAAQAFMKDDIQYEGEQTYLIGQEAVDRYLTENKNRQPGVKRLIFTGRWRSPGTGVIYTASQAHPTEAMREYYEEIDYGTGRLLQALKSSLRTHFQGTAIFGRYYKVEELIGLFVKEIKLRAEKQINAPIDNIMAGRPVYFSEVPNIDARAQKRLEYALHEVGFKRIDFQLEPVAAAKQFLTQAGKGKTILVFDFGGGTLDTAIVRMKEKPEVLSTNGVYIGGDLLNADIMQAKLWNYFGAFATWGDNRYPMPLHLFEALGSWYSIPMLNNPSTMELLGKVGYKNSDPQALSRFIYLIKAGIGFEVYEAIERAKKELSAMDESRIAYQDGPISLDLKISRTEFERTIAPRIKEIRETVLQTLEQARLEPLQVDLVVQTGGSSLIPAVERMLEEIFGKEKITLFETFTSIAAGLALE